MGKKKKIVSETVSVPKIERKVAFDAWFQNKVSKGKLRDYQSKAIKTFFGKKGLTEMEETEKFDDVFTNY